jgi:hypothetical protein
MKRKVRKTSKASKVAPQRKGIKHHVKLATFLALKLIIALALFTLGVYIGKIFHNPLVIVTIASVIAVLLYLLSILHVIKLFRI